MSDPLEPLRTGAAAEALSAISERAFRVAERCMRDVTSPPSNEHCDLLERMLAAGESTSLAVRRLAQNHLHIPAIALARVRLEQTIICSYLVHEAPERGLQPYALHVPVQHYHSASDVLRDPHLRDAARAQLDLGDLERRAIEATQQIDPDFDPATGTLKRKWTTLDLYSMAIRRDQLATSQGSLLAALPLALTHTALYRPASAVVHSDASSYSWPFTLANRPDPAGVNPAVFWPFAVLAYVATCDVTQCMEIPEWAGVAVRDKFMSLISALAAMGTPGGT